MIKYFFLIIVSVSTFSQSSYGFCCIGTNFIDKSDSALKIRYTNNFKGAIFTGKVISVETVEVDVGISSLLTMKKLTIEADKYWFGINDRNVDIYTEFFKGDFGPPSEKEEKKFFIANYDNEKKLWLNSCEYNIFETSMINEESLTKRFTEILGKPEFFD